MSRPLTTFVVTLAIILTVVAIVSGWVWVMTALPGLWRTIWIVVGAAVVMAGFITAMDEADMF